MESIGFKWPTHVDDGESSLLLFFYTASSLCAAAGHTIFLTTCKLNYDNKRTRTVLSKTLALSAVYTRESTNQYQCTKNWGRACFLHIVTCCLATDR
jgi:hypothetical protein